MSPASKRSPSFARGRARASIASERSMPSVSPAASSSWRRAVSSPVPHPRSTTHMPGRRRTSASRPRKGRARSSRKRSYCAGSQASRVMQDELPIRRPDRLQPPPAMRSSDAANRPRWSGQAGFFEIWFLVVFEAAARRAWWFRYTTFAPAAGLQPGTPRATLWAAAFDARAPEPAIAVKHILGAEDYHAGSPERFAIRLGSAELRNDACRGEVESGAHRIAWALRFTPAAREARRAPWLLQHLPLPTRVAHANSEIACSGWVSVDGVRHELDGAPTVQKHIWGTRRVEELYWLYCPRFDEEVAACLEATAVRLRRRPGVPRLVPIWFRTAHSVLDRCGLASLVGNRVEVRGPTRLEFLSTSATRSLRVEAWCDPRTLAGYVYRDPAGWDVHAAPSDVASVTLELRRRPHPLAAWRPPRRLTCSEGAALELHAPEPLPGVRYLGWGATGS